MPSLQVRDMPAPLYRRLKQAAKHDHRSLAQEAVAILERGLNIQESPRERRRKILGEIEKMSAHGEHQGLDSPADILREDRSR
jgi:plasmid stability protein